MYRTFLFLVLHFCLVSPAFTDTPQHYVIPDIEISIPKSDLTKAPFSQAVKLGQMVAFTQVLQRFGRGVKEGTAPDAVGHLISRVQVASEKKTEQLYRARLIYYFDIVKTKAFMENNSVKAKDMPAVVKTKLVIPVMVLPDGTCQMWGDDLPWGKAWAATSAKTGAIFPLGDAEDIAHFTEATIDQKDEKLLSYVKNKYHDVECYVVKAKLGFVKAGKHQGEFSVASMMPGASAPVTKQIEADSKDQLLSHAVEQLMGELKGPLTTQVAEAKVVVPERLTILDVDIPFAAPTEYYAIEEKLKKINVIKAVDTDSMAYDCASIKISFMGDQIALNSALKEQQLALRLKDDKLILCTQGVTTP